MQQSDDGVSKIENRASTSPKGGVSIHVPFRIVLLAGLSHLYRLEDLRKLHAERKELEPEPEKDEKDKEAGKVRPDKSIDDENLDSMITANGDDDVDTDEVMDTEDDNPRGPSLRGGRDRILERKRRREAEKERREMLAKQPKGSKQYQRVLKRIDDLEAKMAGLAAARVVFPQMLQEDMISGPFVCTLTDLHRSNIIVDNDWNITRIIDLEFACSWPLEFQQPPYWLGGQCADEIDRSSFGPYHDRFVQTIEEQEGLLSTSTPRKLSAIMRHAWASGTFWLSLAIQDPIAFSSIFWYRILPYRFHLTIDHTTDLTLLANLVGGVDTLQKKLQDYDQYSKQLDCIFEEHDVDASR